jgi:hypothetical protein
VCEAELHPRSSRRPAYCDGSMGQQRGGRDFRRVAR